MKTTDKGRFVAVKASRSDVAQFASKWPCCGINGSVYAEFDRRNGDLVDVRVAGQRDYDGSDLAALVDDMKAFAGL